MSEYIPTIYIAGPMTGRPDFNFPAFHRVAERLREMGWKVINPAENHSGDQRLTHEEYMRTDIPQVVSADALYAMNGWEDSKGASLEVKVADACGLRLIDHMQSPDVALCGDDSVVAGRPTGGRWASWPKAGAINVSEKSINPLPWNGIPNSTPVPTTDPFNVYLDRIRELHDRKKADYTGGKHPLANYKNAGESIGVTTVQAMFSRMNEKVFRAKELLASGAAPQVLDESLGDTFRDIAIISILIGIALDPASGWGD